MSSLFLSIVNMSISAFWIILAVIILRLILKKAPGWFRMSCWALVGLRLILPFSIESKLSLLPNADPIGADIMLSSTPSIYSGITAVDKIVNPVLQQAFTPDPGSSMNPLQFWIPAAAVVWLVGVAALIVYMCVSFYRLRRQVNDAVLSEDGVYCSEKVVSPFVLGILRPKIYLPTQMWENEKEYVLAHEKTHLRRLDHWWKPLGFMLLAIHWFNPLVWVAYVMFCRDLEFACDEAVIKDLNSNERADYSQALLNCCTQRTRISACPLAFGEVGVKERIKSVLSYKKPALWIISAATVALVVTCVCLLTSPVNPVPTIPTSPIGEDIKNPDFVYAWGGEASSTNLAAVSTEAKEAIIPMIFDHEYILIEQFTPISHTDIHKAPGGYTLKRSDYKTSFHIDFSYGTTSERWTFLSIGIQRVVNKSNNPVAIYWYRNEPAFTQQVLTWCKEVDMQYHII